MTPTTAIDADIRQLAAEAIGVDPSGDLAAKVALSFQRLRNRIFELDHIVAHFQKLARVNAEADHALDTARREWVKRGEGK